MPYTLLRFVGLPPRLFWLAAWLTNDHFLLSVVGVVRDDQGRLLLFHHTYRKKPWGLPGGWLKRGESPLEGLAREIREESGLVVEATRLLLVGSTADRPKHEFVVEGRLIGGEFRPSGEVSAMRWCSRDNLPAMPPNYSEVIARVERLSPGEVGWYANTWASRRRR